MAAAGNDFRLARALRPGADVLRMHEGAEFIKLAEETSLIVPVGEYVLDRVIGVVKAYSTCVGEGPFTAEWFGEEAARLREEGAEYGAATGRPRRVGPMDIVATRYGVTMQGDGITKVISQRMQGVERGSGPRDSAAEIVPVEA